MSHLNDKLTSRLIDAFGELYNVFLTPDQVHFQATRKEFAGDTTFNVFPFLKEIKRAPEIAANDLGECLKGNSDIVESFNVVKGFLNIVISDEFWLNALGEIHVAENFGIQKPAGEHVMVEYSSPNTNKPLHLGHLRNNFLGFSVSEILAANGQKVTRTQIINDRGIHICKSMLAWQKFGNGETPSAELKGDKLVGKYYVAFEKAYRAEIAEMVQAGTAQEIAEKQAPILLAAKEMLLQWEANDPEVRELWEKMNAWVYEGFDATYAAMGVHFEKLYYESDTFEVGRQKVMEGLKKGVFIQKEDGSVWCDLTDDGLDEKILLRSDGTSVYMTQDIGTAILRFEDHPDLVSSVYTVGNEQEYHFKVLFLILKKLGYSWAERLYHLSYGMVDLPEGKMKSREGTVVDADDLMREMSEAAREMTTELGKLDDLDEAEKVELFHMIGMAALKYYLLKVDPKKKILFDPKSSIDLNGNTGPFIQYTHARIHSLLRKAGEMPSAVPSLEKLGEVEKELIVSLSRFPKVVQDAGANYSPALVANYTYDLVKKYNHFYQTCPVMKEDNMDLRNLRLIITQACGQVVKNGMGLLGIQVPDRM